MIAPELVYLNPVTLVPHNHRSGKIDVSDLIESVREHGVIEPLIVRHVGETIEIVCGCRRRVAAMEVGLAEVPCLMRDMPDDEALAVQIVENRDRKDVHPMDEAEAYGALLSMPRADGLPRTVVDVAARVGVDAPCLTRRLALLKLDPDVRAVFLAGRIETSVAMLIATLRKADQKKASADLAAPEDGSRGPVPYRSAREHVTRTFLLRLADAPFSLTAEDLVPGVGGCASCPKRTGSNPDLFGGFESDELCTDPACHAKKVSAAWERLAIAARDSGQTVIGDKEAGEVFRFGASTVSSESAFVDVDDPCRDDPKERTFRDILGAGLPTPSVARDGRGGIHYLLDRKVARKAVLATLPKKAVERAEEADKAQAVEDAAAIEDKIRKSTYALAIAEFGKRVKRGLPMRVVIDALLPRAPDTRKAHGGDLDKLHGDALSALALAAALEIVGFDAFMRGEEGPVEAVAKTYQVDLVKVRARASEPPAEKAKKAKTKK